MNTRAEVNRVRASAILVVGTLAKEVTFASQRDATLLSRHILPFPTAR
jgi:hypothetical protein